jgi:hypothetical protein
VLGRWCIAAVLLVYAAMVVSHQLSPYLTVLTMLPAVVSGLLRPAWLPAASLAIAAAFLVPNFAFVQERWGVVSGFDPVQNATYSPATVGTVPLEVVLQGQGVLVLTLVVVCLALVGAVRRARAGHLATALLVLSTAVSPALLLAGQTYGGEGRLRVVLFALPWLSMAAAWAFLPDPLGAPGRRSGVVTESSLWASVLVLAGLTTLTSLQPQADIRVRGPELTASDAVYSMVREGDLLLLTAPQFPVLQTANYYVPTIRELSGLLPELPGYRGYEDLDVETLPVVLLSLVPRERGRGATSSSRRRRSVGPPPGGSTRTGAWSGSARSCAAPPTPRWSTATAPSR